MDTNDWYYKIFMYLSKIYIKNFRGIKELLVEFDKNLNVIIGANGQLKTSLIDAIRLFYAWGEPNRDIEITKEDFYVEVTSNVDGSTTVTPSAKIDICYLFEGLSAQQEGAFYQYLDRKDDGTMVARVHLCFEMKEKGRIVSSYITGNEDNVFVQTGIHFITSILIILAHCVTVRET